MLKLSFKDCGDGIKPKTILHRDKTTIVILVGHVEDVWGCNLGNIWIWATKHPFFIGMDAFRAVGKARCSKGDDYDPIIGERIAEARAKIKLYKFMVCLLNRICEAKGRELYGSYAPEGIVSFKDCWVKDRMKYRRLLTNENLHLEKLLKETGYEFNSKGSE